MGKKRIGLCSVARDSDGLSVVVRIDNWKYTIDAVPENVLRCSLGSDLAYLLGEQARDDYDPGVDDPEDKFVVPGRDESACFSLSVSEFKDCMRYGVIRRDMTGRPEIER